MNGAQLGLVATRQEERSLQARRARKTQWGPRSISCSVWDGFTEHSVNCGLQSLLWLSLSLQHAQYREPSIAGFRELDLSCQSVQRSPAWPGSPRPRRPAQVLAPESGSSDPTLALSSSSQAPRVLCTSTTKKQGAEKAGRGYAPSPAETRAIYTFIYWGGGRGAGRGRARGVAQLRRD